MRRRGRPLWVADHPAPAQQIAWKRADAGDLRRDPGGRRRLPEAAVHDHRRGRRGRCGPADPAAERRDRDRVRDRRHPLGCGRLHRHEPVGASQRQGRGGRPRRHPARPRHRLQGRLGDRAPGRRPRPARGGGLLRRPDPARLLRQGVRRRPDRARLRRLADLGLRPPRRRDLHQGRRRRGRPGRKDRGGDPRGRPTEPGGDRRQRRRQRRRLRRDGRRPLRDLRGYRGRGDAARGSLLHRRLRPRGGDLPAGARRRRDPRLDRRRILRAHPLGQRRAGALSGTDRLRIALGGRLLSDHQVADGGRTRQRRRIGGRGGARRRKRHRPLALFADRGRRHGLPVRDHRLLHLDPLPPGEDDRRARPRPATRPTSSRGSPRDFSRPRRRCW